MKFPTECFFFTFHCHHLSIIPCFRKFAQRLRAIRDMNRLINELESRDSEWRNTPMAARNRAMLKKWKSQIKVTHSLVEILSWKLIVISNVFSVLDCVGS